MPISVTVPSTANVKVSGVPSSLTYTFIAERSA